MKGFLYAFLLLAIPIEALGSDNFQKPIFYESSPERFNVSAPNEQRDEKYSKFFGVSLKVHVDGASGSGTICNYDENSGFAHVISCGHLWSGNMDYVPGKRLPKAKIVTWYKNNRKLSSPETFDAEVLFWSNERGYDVSLLRFKPDWSSDFATIDESFNPKVGMILNSLGCDGGGEVARYEVVFKETAELDFITVKNSPRPGRSGGGLLTDSGRIVGVCWGTSDTSSGKGIGYFTPVSSIKKVFVRNGYGWLVDVLSFKSIPIVDRDNPEVSYESEFVPFPGGF